MELVYFLSSVVLISISGALMPGPVLAVVVRNAPRNRLAGVEAALGHGLVELPLVAAISLGFASILASDWAHTVIGLIGGAALVLMGLAGIAVRDRGAKKELRKRTQRSIAAGLLASLNPYFFLWWATAGAAIVAKALTWSWGVLALMFAAHISVDILWFGSVGIITHKSMQLSNRWQRPIAILCGFAMVCFGIYFISSALFPR